MAYKARLAGIPLVFVDPRNTSRTCAKCGYCAKANRPSQAVFRCVHCLHSDNADRNAALNIAFKATAIVNSPTAGTVAGIGPLEAKTVTTDSTPVAGTAA